MSVFSPGELTLVTVCVLAPVKSAQCPTEHVTGEFCSGSDRGPQHTQAECAYPVYTVLQMDLISFNKTSAGCSLH